MQTSLNFVASTQMTLEGINHVRQTPDGHDCVLACIAMVSGRTLEEIATGYSLLNRGAPYVTKQDEECLFVTLGIDFIAYSHAIMMPGRVYLITVASKNREGCFHRVVVDWRNAEFLQILDPQHGLLNAFDPLENYLYNIPGYSEVTEICRFDSYWNSLCAT